jgi:transposase-like protein
MGGRTSKRVSVHVLTPVEVTADKAAVYPRVLDVLAPAAYHHAEQYANNRMETDHGQLKRRLRPMRGLKTDRGPRLPSPGMHSCRTSTADTTKLGSRT